MPVAPVYSSFGNWLKGDCEYAAMANLFEHQYPAMHLTTKQVLDAWHNGNGETYYSAIDFMRTVGFNGKTATITPLQTRAEIIQAANHGGVWATVQSGQHAVAIVAASAKGLLVVDSTMGNGMKYFEPWGMWAKYLAGTGEEYWGLHWNQP